MRAMGWLSGTEVALKAALASSLESHKEHDDDSKVEENSINLGSSTAAQDGSLFLTWINHVQCDGGNASIISSALRSDSNQLDSSDGSGSSANVVAFSFINMNAQSNTGCIWDPAVGATLVASTKASTATSVVASSLAVVAAVFALF